MAGKKRRKSSASSGKASAKRKSKTSKAQEVSVNVCSTVLGHVLEIASSKSRSRETLQSFYDGKCWTETKKITEDATVILTTSPVAPSSSSARAASRSKPMAKGKQQIRTNFDSYWIILATNVMNRLLRSQSKETKGDSSLVKYLTALSDALTTVLLCDKSKLEKCAQQPAGRSILCRTILTTTLAAMYGIRNYDPRQEADGKHDVYVAAVATLDRLVHLRSSCNIYEDIIHANHEEQNANLETDMMSTVGNWTDLKMEPACSLVEELLESAAGNSEHDCVRILLDTIKWIPSSESRDADEEEEVQETEKSSTQKRSTRARSGGKTAKSSATKRKSPTKRSPGSPEDTQNAVNLLPIVTTFEKLLSSEDFNARIDARVAIKRCASIAIVWSQQGDGQTSILREIHEFSTGIEYDSVFSTFQKSRLISVLISIVIESGTQCGVRPPTGTLENYLVRITTTPASKSPKESKAKRSKKSSRGEDNSHGSIDRVKKSKSLRRGDIRDWATVVVYDYLQNHKKCLLENAESNPPNQNRRDSQTSNDTEESDPFPLPKFPDVVNGLCRIAASSVRDSPYSQQNSWKKTLLSIAAAFCFEISTEPEVPLDSKMINFALSQFVDNMRMMDPHSSIGITSSSRVALANSSSFASEKQIQDFESKHMLRLGLPRPIVPRLDLDSDTAKSCSFAGIVKNGSSFSDEHAIALAIRAVQAFARQGDPRPATGTLLTFFIDIVKRAYDTSISKKSADLQEHKDSFATIVSGGKRKRKSTKSSSANRRGARRRKVDSGEGKEVNSHDTLVWNRISSEKASIAITALNAVRMWLMNTKRLGSCAFRRMLRTTVTTDHMIDLVKLGDTLDKIMITSRRTRTNVTDSTVSLPSTNCSSSSPSGDDFTSSEILLWNAHMSMCQVFGRGQLTYAENSGMDPIIWNSDNRMAVYKAVAGCIDERRSEGIDKKVLSLPAAHSALLTANMSCAVKEGNKNPEKHLVTSYINAITIIFRSLDNLVPKDWGPNGRIIDDDIPLSYSDARTLLLALEGLTIEEKCQYFDILVSSATDALKPLLNSKTKRESMLQNPEVSGFVARVLVVCYSLVARVASGKEFEQIFYCNMGCTQMSMPSFVTRADWYRQDRTFMGVFETWKSPSFPEIVVGKRESSTSVQKMSLDSFRSLLGMCFSIGFDAAPYDHCHLLFTAWNGLDQIPDKSGSSNVGDQFPSLVCTMEDYPEKILQLREDIYSLHQASNDAPIDLKGMISRASEMTDLILTNYIPDDENMRQEIPLPVTILLAALPTYIAAAISGCTKPGNDYFSTTLSRSWTKSSKRSRGYSSESDPPHSECDSDEDADDYESEARLEAISRLRECCDAFGAAPIHPDWLDVSCSLRDGIRPSDAIEMATKAISTLSRLINVAFTRYKRHQSWAFQTILEEQDDTEQSANICSTILRWSRHEKGPSQYPREREWLDDVISLTKFPQKAAKYVVDDEPARDLARTKSCWCPFAGQKLRGLLQEESGLMGGWEITDAELRAGGEWELLLAGALCISCLRTNETASVDQDSVENTLIDADSKAELAKTEVWRTVFMSATSHLVPAAALLRLGLGKVGRKPHPFAFHENDQDPYDSAPLHFSERLNGVAHVASSSGLRGTISETLSLLARLSIEAEESLSVTCHAVASHLVVDTETFLDLEAMSSMKCAFMGLKLVRRLAESSPKKDAKAVIPFIVERLVSLIEHSGRGDIEISASLKNSNFGKFRRLHHFLGDPVSCQLELIGNKSPIDVFKILRSKQIVEIYEGQIEAYKWTQVHSKESVIGELVSILCEDSLRANVRTRSLIALMLSRVGTMEFHSIINSNTKKNSLAINALISSFNKVDKKRLKSFIVKDFCGIRGSKLSSESFRRDVASILCLLLFSRASPKFDKAKFIHDTLMAVFDSWKKINPLHREVTLKVLMTYGAFFNSIFEIGSKLVEVTGSRESRDAPNGEPELLSIYFAFIKNLQEALTKRHISASASKKKTKSRVLNADETLRHSKFPKSCSYIQKSGFHGQHWYHCHTCGLVADKGCCTLCALVCHKGHDVTYSRHSSFFCDCAAEDGNSAEQNRVSCKCLSSLAAGELDSMFEQEQSWRKRSVDTSKRENIDCAFENSILIEIAKNSFPNAALESVNKFLTDIRKSSWLDSLFRVLKNEVIHWKAKYGNSVHFVLKKCCEANLDAKPIFRLSQTLFQGLLRKRRSKVLELNRLEEKGFVSVCVASGFLEKLPSDSSTHDVLTLSRLSRNSVSRSILVFDSRGRMIIAEPSSLVFCSPMAAVNGRTSCKSEDDYFTRHQMCILGSASLPFNVVGLRLCTENERHMIAWGASEACMLVLKTDYSGVEDTISLCFEGDDQDRDGDVLVNCEWLPGSQTHIAVGVSRYIRLFDVRRFESAGETKRANPVIGYNLGFDASLRDLSIVPLKGEDSSEDDAKVPFKNLGTEFISKMYLLLENGRLHSLDIKIFNGRIESPSELHFEPSECVSISIEGIRIQPRLSSSVVVRGASSVGLPGASMRTLGEGSKLAYLKQSRCLLYKCKSAAVVALMLGTNGNVTGTFELLPHTINSDVVGSDDEDDVYSISGPYTLWTELGMVYRNGSTYFRVACAGRSNRNSQPKLLSIEFNDKETMIEDITCSLGSGLSLCSFEGLGAFTSPIIYDNVASRDRHMTGERTFLSVLTSGGNLHIFGEDLVDMIPTTPGPHDGTAPMNPVELVSMSRIISTPTKKFPLTIFEQLTNVSENENLSFAVQGFGINPKELKNKLARDSSSSIAFKRGGCCMTIRLSQGEDTSRCISEDKSSSFVISAIRILVGSTPNATPSNISVQGRSIDITPKLKRWYNVPLTDEEIARGIRSGLISLWIGPSFDPTNAPVVDSVEVFASERKAIEKSLPTGYYSQTSAATSIDILQKDKGPSNTEVTSDDLLLGVVATTNMCELMGPSIQVSDTAKDLLRELMQLTTVHPDRQLGKSCEILSNFLASNSRSKWSFRDENMLIGCLRSLDECNALLEESSTNTYNDFTVTQDMKWNTVRIVIKDCLKVSTLIARERPTNYLQSMGNMQEKNLKSASIAIEASNLILKGLKNSNGFEELVGGNRGIVTLSLTEMAIVVYMDDSISTKDFIQTSKIREFLDVANVSTCEAISSFFQDSKVEQNKNKIPDLFVQMEAARRVAYQCDSCGICPMEKVRYTILEEDYGMDLCKKCYEVGKTFASKNSQSSSTEVVINGKSMGENLTCAHMKKMEPVSLEKMEMDVEELEVLILRPDDEDKDCQKDAKLREVESLNDSNQLDLSDDHRGYEYFLGELFAFVMGQLSFTLKQERCKTSTESLIKLLLDLIRHSKRNSLRHERATLFVRDLSKGISHILNYISRDQKLTHNNMSFLVTYLRGLSSLTTPHLKSEFFYPASESDSIHRSRVVSKGDDKTKFICDVHRIPAVRRRCDKAGPNKDRRFYVCGKEKGERCDYFRWADDGQAKKEVKPSKSQFRKLVQTAMLGSQPSSGESIFDRLCILLEMELFGEEEEGAYEVSILASNMKEKKSEDSHLKSFYSVQNMERDFSDGIFCSKEKLLNIIYRDALVNTEFKSTYELSIPARASCDRGAWLLEASLDLLTLIADHKTGGISRWFSILCEITIATNKHSSLRPLATKVLKALCDGNRKKYHYVRDHFTFCFQLKRLYRFSYIMLEAALTVKEKTRQCSADWRGSAIGWSALGAGGLIGTDDLISEDNITELNLKGCGKALDEMWAIIKNRGGSWRQFCGFRSLPLSQRQSTKPNSLKNHIILEKELSSAPPIKVLFWIASSLTGVNQVKVLRLIDFALIDWRGRRTSVNGSTNNAEDRDTQEKDADDDVVVGIGSAISKPEEILLMPGRREMEVEDIVSLSLHLVRNGNTSELRKAAYQIVTKLAQAISSEERLYLFKNLVASIENAGIMGKASVEFLSLLQCLSQYLEPNELICQIANFVVDSFVQQLNAVKYDRSNCEWMSLESTLGNSVTKKKFDLSGCQFCIKPQHYFGAKELTKASERRLQSSSSRVADRSGSLVVAESSSAVSLRQKWSYEQISSYSRCRLESLKESCSSNEFSLFYKLKHRLSISDIHLTVSDPRGRYVKTISIYVTPRPLSGSLKGDQYDSKWQKIATLNLGKGGSRASVSLSKPIIAANLRVEFIDFYERPGEKEKGGMVLHCPRCTRPVTNAHGVCATCGEVAFQCRKCRHINYDRLDAFLCVECGYTCCGSFSFELNAAVVTNAIAIDNDTSFDKSLKMYNTASSIQEGLKEKLREKIRSLNQKNLNEDKKESFFDPEIERSFLGLLPTNEKESSKDPQACNLLDRFDKQGSVVKYVARPDNISGGNRRSDSSSDRSERARSLIRLARQIRSESSSSSDHRRSTDIIIRHLGRVSLENLEDENELLEIFESGNSETGRGQDENKDSEDGNPKEKENDRTIQMEECQKLHTLLREAWRECYELGRRIDSWKSLNSGALLQGTALERITESSLSFSPSHCSLCGGSIALHLLVLWLKLFLVAPSQVSVKEEFFLILFQDDGQSHGKSLQEVKRQIIIAIATNSQQGAEMVLRELEKRLKASRDMYCAGILGKIMEIEGFVMINEYAKLAMDILSSQADTTARM